MALFDNSSLLLVKSDLKLRGTKEIKLPATKTIPKSMKLNKIKNPILQNNFLFNPIKWDGAKIMKSHSNRATTVNLWSPEILTNISGLLKGSKAFNDSLYSFVKLFKLFQMVKNFFAGIIKALKGGDGHERDTGGTDGNAVGSGVDGNDATAKGGAARGRGEAGGGRGQAAGGGGQAAGGGGLQVEFLFVFSLSARP